MLPSPELDLRVAVIHRISDGLAEKCVTTATRRIAGRADSVIHEGAALSRLGYCRKNWKSYWPPGCGLLPVGKAGSNVPMADG